MSRHFRGLSVLLPAFLLFGSVGVVRAQSLADVAKQEEERRKTIKQPSKVYTNKDLRGVPSPIDAPPPEATKPAPDAAASSEPSGSAGKSSDAGKPVETGKSPAKGDAGKTAVPNEKGPARDQAYWAGRLKELKAQLDRDQTYADALQSRISALTADFTARADPAQRAVIARDKQKALDELERLKKAITSDKKALADLEDEARRAGVPPGWLRS
jgi:hypothetical protein